MDCIESTWLEPPREYEGSASAKFGEIGYKKKPARLANGCGPAKIPSTPIRVGKRERTHNRYLRITSSWKRDDSNMHTFCFPCWAVSLVSRGACYENEMPK
jgi:hypothetical protein